MSKFEVDFISSQDGSRGPDIAGITTFSGTSGIVMPSGDTAYRGGRGRGIFGGGYGASSPYPELAAMDYVQIATTGSGYDFGDLTTAGTVSGGASSSTRGLFWGGRRPPGDAAAITTTIQYVTISSTGNSFFFGDLSYRPVLAMGASDNTRGLFAGGYNAISPYSVPEGVGSTYTSIEYVTIASTGNSSSFGDLTTGRCQSFSMSSPTRGVFGAGMFTISVAASGTTYTNVIDYVTIQSRGNAIDFGDIITARVSGSYGNAGNSSTRGIICSGDAASGDDNELSYITLASKGDAIDFGDSIDKTAGSGGAGTSSQIRGVYRPASGNGDAALETTLIATLGNSTAFGDLNTGRRVYGALSDSHGGLG